MSTVRNDEGNKCLHTVHQYFLCMCRLEKISQCRSHLFYLPRYKVNIWTWAQELKYVVTHNKTPKTF